MKCRKVRKKLVLFLDAGLPQSEAELVHGHLEVCRACRKEAELLRSTLDLAVQRAREKTAPRVPEDYVSLFWQRERSGVVAGRGTRHTVSRRIRWPFGEAVPAKYAIGSVLAVVVAAVVVFALLQGGKPPSHRQIALSPYEPRQEGATPPVADRFAEIEKQLEELEAAVRNLRVPSPSVVSFTGDEMREVYAAIGLAAANNYKDVLKMNDVAVKRYAHVASLYPETAAGREAQEILSRLN